MNRTAVIKHLFPKAIPNKDFYVVDDGDGERIVWNSPESQPTEAQIQAVWPQVDLSLRRQSVNEKWDSQIDAQREVLRKMVDEAKPQAAIDKARTNLKNMIASKNTELMGVK